MSTNSWRGDAPAVAREITLTVGGAVADGDTVSYKLGNAKVLVTASGNTTATLASVFYTALAASDDPRFKEVQWSYTDGDAFVTGTASTPGLPFAGTAAATGTTTLTEAEVTASTGPSHVDEPLNWSAGHVPLATEDVIIERGADLLFGLENITATAYNSFQVKASFTGTIGLSAWNEGGYEEYRTRSFAMGSGVAVTIGEGDGTGPTFVNLALDTNAAVTVHKTGARQSDSVPVVNLTGATTGSVSVAAGDVGLAADDATTTITLDSLTADNAAAVTLGVGATVTTATVDADAKVTAYGSIVTLNITGGTATLYQMPTTVNADHLCLVDLRGTGTTATVNARGQGEGKSPFIECGNNPRAKTFTDHTVTGGAVLHDPDKTLTFTNAGTWDRESLRLSDLGSRFSLKRT